MDLAAGSRVAVLNIKDAEQIGVVARDRVRITGGNGRTATALVDTTQSIVDVNQVGLPRNVAQELKVGERQSVSVQPSPPPVSVEYVHEKMRGKKLAQRGALLNCAGCC